jgi:dTDP-4-dehydrorhamnose reductase
MSWLITGAGGQLGSVLLRTLARAGVPALGIASLEGPLPRRGSTIRLELTDESAIKELILRERPSVVVHAGAVSSVVAAHTNPEHAHRVNAVVTGNLAALCAGAGARFLYVSTDMVFDGESAPYRETSTPAPLSEYGRSKREGELLALAIEGSLVVRLPLLYGVPDVSRASTFLDQVRALREGRALKLFDDEWRTPLSLEDAAASLVRAAKSELTGALHAGGPERLSRVEMGTLLAAALGIREPRIVAASRLAVAAPEPRARDLGLDSTRFMDAFGVAPGRPMRDALAAMDRG